MQLRLQVPALATALAVLFALSTAAPIPQNPNIFNSPVVRRNISLYVEDAADPRTAEAWGGSSSVPGMYSRGVLGMHDNYEPH